MKTADAIAIIRIGAEGIAASIAALKAYAAAFGVSEDAVDAELAEQRNRADAAAARRRESIEARRESESGEQ